MSDITLINASDISPRHPVLPEGALSLAGTLEQAGITVSFGDYQTCQAEDKPAPQTFAGFAAVADSPLLGISVSSATLPTVLGALPFLRAARPELTIILGGPAASPCGEAILRRFAVDVVVHGEGEQSLLELVQAAAAGQHLAGIAGTSCLAQDRLVSGPPRQRITDLDALPPPAYHLVDLDDYYGVGSFSYSRGCPAPAPTCCCHALWTGQVVTRDPACLATQIAAMQGRISMFELCDDALLGDEQALGVFLERLDAEGVTMEWSCGGRAVSLSDHTIRRMGEQGCSVLTLTVDSASQALRQRLGLASDSLDQTRRVIEVASEVIKQVVVLFRWGYPEETLDDFHDTVFAATAYLPQQPRVCPVAIPVVPYPGSHLVERNGTPLRFLPDELARTGGAWQSVGIERYPELRSLVQEHPDLFTGFSYFSQPDLESKIGLLARMEEYSETEYGL